jgi:hypothetical protein
MLFLVCYMFAMLLCRILRGCCESRFYIIRVLCCVVSILCSAGVVYSLLCIFMLYVINYGSVVKGFCVSLIYVASCLLSVSMI